MKPKLSFDIFKKQSTQSQFMFLYNAQPIDLGLMIHKLAHVDRQAARSLAQLCINVPHQREHMIELQTEYNNIYGLLPDLIRKNAFVYARVLPADIPIVCRPLDLEELAK